MFNQGRWRTVCSFDLLEQSSHDKPQEDPMQLIAHESCSLLGIEDSLPGITAVTAEAYGST